MRVFQISAIIFTFFIVIIYAPLYAQPNDDIQLHIESIHDENFPELQVEVTVLDAQNHPIPRLSQENFTVREDGVTADVTGFETSDLGISVVLVIDTSDSMYAINAAKDAALAFVDSLRPQDSVAVIDFDTDVNILQRLTQEHQRAREVISGELQQGGRTALYDGALAAVQEAASATQGRRIVVLLADGNESGESVAGRSTALDRAIQEGIPIYTVGLGASADRAYLENIATLTGGLYLDAPRSELLSELYTDLAKNLQQAYLLSIHSQVPGDGGTHELSIEVNLDNGGGSAQSSRPFRAAQIAPKISLGTPPDEPLTGTVEFTPEIDIQGTRYEIAWQLDENPVARPPTTPPYTLSLDTHTLQPGSHTLMATITDAAGLQAEATLTFEIPVLPPQVRISGLDNDSQLSDEAVTVRLNVDSQTPVEEVRFQLDDEAADIQTDAPFTYRINPVELAAGDHTLTITVQNASETPFEEILTFETTLAAPVVTLDGIPEDDATEPFTVQAVIEAATENTHIEWWVDNEKDLAAQTDELSLNPQDMEPGEHSVTVTVTDDFELSTTTSAVVTIAALPPDVTIRGLSNDEQLAADEITVRLNIDSQTPVEEVSFQVDDSEAEILSESPYTYRINPVELVKGTHTFTITVYNASETPFEETLTFETTLAAPAITFEDVPETAVAEAFTLQAGIEAETENLSIEWQIDDEVQTAAQSTELAIDPEALEPGEHAISMTVTDDFELSTTETTTLTIDALPPHVTIGGLAEDDELGEEAVTIRLMVESQTPVKEVRFQLNDDDPVVLNADATPYVFAIDPLELAYLDSTEHKLSIDVVNEGDKSFQESLHFTTTVRPPTATLSGLPEGNQAEAFTLTLNAEAQTPVEVNWLLDGAAIIPRSVEGAYLLDIEPITLQPGDHTISIKVTDRRGLAYDLPEQTFSIAALPPLITVKGLAESQTIKEVTDVTLDIQSQTTVTEVLYQMDNGEPQSIQSPPYLYTLNPDDLDKGEHTLSITVTNQGGQKSIEIPSFTVQKGLVLNNTLLIVGIVAILAVMIIGIMMIRNRTGVAEELPGKAWLVYEDILTGNEIKHKIQKKETLIGRASINDIILPDPEQRISREHAAVVVSGKGWAIEDRDSKEGVLINGEKIKVNQKHPIGHEDKIKLVSVELTFKAPGFEVTVDRLRETAFQPLSAELEEQTPPPPERRQTHVKEDSTAETDIESPPSTEKRITQVKDDSDSHATELDSAVTAKSDEEEDHLDTAMTELEKSSDSVSEDSLTVIGVAASDAEARTEQDIPTDSTVTEITQPPQPMTEIKEDSEELTEDKDPADISPSEQRRRTLLKDDTEDNTQA